MVVRETLEALGALEMLPIWEAALRSWLAARSSPHVRFYITIGRGYMANVVNSHHVGPQLQFMQRSGESLSLPVDSR